MVRAWVCVVLAAAIGGCAAPSPTAPGSGPAAAVPLAREFRPMVVGLCEDHPEESRSIAQAREDFELMRSAGVTHLRIALGWDGIEPRDDQFDWAFWDEFVRVATGEYGIRLLPYFCYTPEWAAAAGEGMHTTRPPADLAEWAEFVGEACRRYGPVIDSWEVWNEPDNAMYWTGSAEEFAALVRTAATAVRAADPGAAVVLGGIAWNTRYVEDLFREQGIAPHVDVVNIHSYFETWIDEPAEAVLGYTGKVADIIARYGEGEAVRMAEVGYSSYRGDGGRVSDLYEAVYGYEHTPEYQGVFLLRMLAMLAASERVPLVAWYRVRDLPAAEEVIGDVNNRHLGVATVEGRPKPALAALRLGAELFSRPFRSVDREVRVERAVRSDAKVHCFERSDGSYFAVAWLGTMVVGERGAVGGDAEDRRVERVTLVLPRGIGGAAGLRDAEGAEVGSAPVRRVGGGSAVDLELRGGGVVLVEVGPAAAAGRE